MRDEFHQAERRATWYVPMYETFGESPPPPEPPPRARVTEDLPLDRERSASRPSVAQRSPLQRLASFRSEARVAVVRRGRSLEDLARRVQRRLRARSLVRELTSEPAPEPLAEQGHYRPLPDCSVFGDPAEVPSRLPLGAGGVHVEEPPLGASPVPAPRASLRGKASIASHSSCESSEANERPEADSVRSADSGVYSESEGCGSPPRPPPRPSKRRRRKRERYEVCLGYRCYQLEADHCTITVYSLQKNKTALRELLQAPSPAASMGSDRGESHGSGATQRPCRLVSPTARSHSPYNSTDDC